MIAGGEEPQCFGFNLRAQCVPDGECMAQEPSPEGSPLNNPPVLDVSDVGWRTVVTRRPCSESVLYCMSSPSSFRNNSDAKSSQYDMVTVVSWSVFFLGAVGGVVFLFTSGTGPTLFGDLSLSVISIGLVAAVIVSSLVVWGVLHFFLIYQEQAEESTPEE